MISDFRTVGYSDLPEDAVVIVGSGAAGMALAERLADLGRQVVLLESGDDDHISGAQTAPDMADLNQGINDGLPYLGLEQGRARTLGGTTQLWHGQCMRLHDIDLQDRPWIAHSGWPLSPDDLKPSYAAAEQWLNVTGIGYSAERWSEHPDLPPVNWNPDYLLHDFTEYTPRPMLGTEHRPRLIRDKLIHVLVNATVARVLVDHDRVVGAEIADRDGQRTTISATEVILAAGAIENARLLQLSDPDGVGLGIGREHTGRYLQDHVIVRTAKVVAKDYRVLQDRYVALHRGDRRLFPKVRLSDEAQKRFGLVDANAVFMHEHDQPGLAAGRRLLQAARERRLPGQPLGDLRAVLKAPGPVARDAYRRFVTGQATGEPPAAVWLQIWLEQAPDPESRITLGSSTDHLGLRRAQVHWRTNDIEIETSRRMTQWIAQDLQRLELADVIELESMRSDDAWRAGVTDAFHPSGTTRMSLDPADGVVDSDLQVHGIAGLYIVGGSVFPIGGYANPTLTIVALALRLADRLAATAAIR